MTLEQRGLLAKYFWDQMFLLSSFLAEKLATLFNHPMPIILRSACQYLINH